MNGALLAAAGLVLLFGAALLFLRTVWFHRDPNRSPEEAGGVLIAPADGMVVYARPFRHGRVVSEKLGERIPVTEITGTSTGEEHGWMLGIYMSPLDVHFNYAPCAGVVHAIHHQRASLNLPMLDLWEYIKMVWFRRLVQLFGRRFHLENERTTLFLDGESVRLALVLIADKFVSKINCFVSAGQKVACSEKLAFIGRGSQVDVVIFDENVRLEVSPGMRVRGGETVIARIGEKEPC
jgi:phosphatidylserine decarboxylase